MNGQSSQQQSKDGRHDDDAALTEFLASLMDYTPTVSITDLYLGITDRTAIVNNYADSQIPDELVEHYLGKSGFQCPDVRLTRLVAVATQKFIADVATDALQQCKARQSAVIKDKRDKQQKDKRLILTMEDLSKALREYGVNVKHQEYFADSPSAGLDAASREE
ncbi:UNVERIFIED_CONTAM: Transcription initiation factor TFIID subunit [Sesamum latifolium]|uniref:Transcription initiation factor TFIID subunit 10 n=1 Tax=Sesamum latifolium TaxID=2727402 RepID=A0AAW2SN48_9LAMI